MISDYIPTGKANRVRSKDLATILGYRSVRDLQKAIETERAHGAVILSACTDGGGYWLPDADELHEVKRFIQTLESRSRNTLAALDSAKLFLNEREGG